MKDYSKAREMADRIRDMVMETGIHAARVTDTEPPVVEVYGITKDVLKITVDVE